MKRRRLDPGRLAADMIAHRRRNGGYRSKALSQRLEVEARAANHDRPPALRARPRLEHRPRHRPAMRRPNSASPRQRARKAGAALLASSSGGGRAVRTRSSA